MNLHNELELQMSNDYIHVENFNILHSFLGKFPVLLEEDSGMYMLESYII